MELRKKKNYAIVLGARPNFIKVAPFLREAKNRPDFSFTIIHTGQHFDENMSRIFFEEMKIPKPDIHLETRGDLHTEKLGNMFSDLQRVLSEERFDGVILIGDINSTVAGAIAVARYSKNAGTVVHIEAGLRNHDSRMPEEINRAIVDHLSDILFAIEPSSKENLMKEGIPESRIHLVGDIAIESLEVYKKEIEASDILKRLGLKEKQYVVATIHRQENTESAERLEAILIMLADISKKFSVIIPLHPGTYNKINEYGQMALLRSLKVVEPMGYFDFVRLMALSRGVVTDSGGMQSETSHLGVACCTLQRHNNEIPLKPVAVELGSNKLFQIDRNNVPAILEHLQRDDFKARSIPLWDDQVSKRMFEHL